MILPATTAVLFACAVCGYATPEQEGAVLRSTLVMTIGPLMLLGAVSWYVISHFKTGKDSGFKKPEAK